MLEHDGVAVGFQVREKERSAASLLMLLYMHRASLVKRRKEIQRQLKLQASVLKLEWPKAPQTSYNFYASSVIEDVRQTYPDKSNVDIRKTLRAMWKELPTSKRVSVAV